MIKRKIFKKKNYLNFYLILTLLSVSIILFVYFYFLKSKDFFYIPFNISNNYIIPENLGGKEIPNQDKKGLHLSLTDKEKFNIKNDQSLKYSIQIYVNNDYKLVNEERLKFINADESIFLDGDLYIAQFNSILGREYFLLYKNFLSRDKALNYCKKYFYFTDNCLIVNVQNLD